VVCRYRVIFVVPEIDPDIVKDPEAVVTVQSEICADGFDRTELTTTCLFVILLFVIV